MKFILAAAFIAFSFAANAQGMVCGTYSKIIDAMIKSHVYPVWAGASKGGEIILFRGEDGKWVIVADTSEMACILAAGENSKFAEGI